MAKWRIMSTTDETVAFYYAMTLRQVGVNFVWEYEDNPESILSNKTWYVITYEANWFEELMINLRCVSLPKRYKVHISKEVVS